MKTIQRRILLVENDPDLLRAVARRLRIAGYTVAEAATIAPFIYIQLLFATFFGWSVFDELPDLWVFVGAAVVIGSGLYIWWREGQRARRKRAAQQSAAS